MKTPPYLTPGSLVYITAPAKAIEASSIRKTQEILESWGLAVRLSTHCLGQHHYFSGTDEERTQDFQSGLDAPDVHAILCARGGYGCVRIVEQLSWNMFQSNPKWIVGFSDVTVFHHKVHQLGLQSIHGIMPLGFVTGTHASRETLKKALFGLPYRLEGPAHPKNIPGEVEGVLIGGNMTLVYSMLGTPLRYDFKDKILLLEDIGEHIYKIDRMLYSLQLAGVLSSIKGLILGGFTEMEDTDIPFGKSIEALIYERVKSCNIPVAFGLPFGHVSDNQGLVLGKPVKLLVTNQGSTLLI
jgi:muramoyltetrapeptide carboxypeptidase